MPRVLEGEMTTTAKPRKTSAKKTSAAPMVACPECLAPAGQPCFEPGTSRSLLVVHAARRTLSLDLADPPPKPKRKSRKRKPEPHPDGCFECGHLGCPIVPDCSGCSECMEFAAQVSARTALDPYDVMQGVDCPECDALRGLPCRTKKGGTRAPHLGRREAELERRRGGAPKEDPKEAAAAEEPGPSAAVAVWVAIADLRRDGGTQPRAAIDPAVVDEYAAAYRGGAPLPPVIAFFDGETYWLADGFHRTAARESNGDTTIEVEVRQGTRRDAVLHSCSANAQHGLRRSNADKRRAVLLLLEDEEWARKSDRWIAKICAVHPSTVGEYRRHLSDSDTSIEAPAERMGQDGKLYPASQPRPAEPTDEPPADPCEVCRGLGEPDGCPGCERVECSLCYGHGGADGTRCYACGLTGDGEADVDDDAAEPSAPTASAPPAPPPARPASWREKLELPPGRVESTRVLEAYERLVALVSGDERRRDELDRAKAVGLSQWDTKEGLAHRMAELALAGLQRGPCVLEPSAGTGALVDAVRRLDRDAHITAHELDPGRVSVLERHGNANVVLAGDFLQYAVPSRPYDVSIGNTPYERGLDGRFLERMMEVSLRVVALLRLNAMTGRDRCERVWSQVQSGAWCLDALRYLETRPGFEGPGEDSAMSDYVVIRLIRGDQVVHDRRTEVDWW